MTIDGVAAPCDLGDRCHITVVAPFTRGRSAAFTIHQSVLTRRPPSACRAFDDRRKKRV
jgi:hypothetical protein